MSNHHDHYQTLGLPRTADIDAIKRAYREQIRKYHPDQLAGERARLARGDDIQALRDIEKRIRQAKTMTQRINTAYAVLSDAARRRDYDAWLADTNTAKASQAVHEWRSAHPDYERRAVKSRPHRRPDQAPTLAEEAAPWLMIAALFIGLALVSYMIRGFLIGVETAQTARPTAIGFDANEIQAMQNATSTVYALRTQRAAEPTSTPRPLSAILAAGDALYEMGSYALAIEVYDDAIKAAAHEAAIYHKRAQAYAALYRETQSETDFAAALIDFERALQLDDSLRDVLRVRGLLYYGRWQRTAAPADAANARADLEAYAAQGEALDEAVRAALDALPA